MKLIFKSFFVLALMTVLMLNGSTGWAFGEKPLSTPAVKTGLSSRQNPLFSDSTAQYQYAQDLKKKFLAGQEYQITYQTVQGAFWDVIENFPEAKKEELAGSYFYLAYSTLVYEKNNDQALIYCQKALDKSQTEEIKLFQLKLMNLKNDPRYQQTAEDYLQGDFTSARESALTDLARYYAQTHQWDKALLTWVLIEKNVSGKAQNYALFEQGKVYLAMGSPKQAKEIFERLMRESKQRGMDPKDGLYMNLDAELVKLK